MWSLRLVALSLAVCAASVAAGAQETPQEEAEETYFSGTVIEYEGSKVTVNRTVLGKNSSLRTFVLTPSTRIEGRLRLKVRVTVQYVSTPEGDQATHIIVRGSRK